VKVIEIRRYTTVDGKDVFGEWLAELNDLKARARIAVRIDRLASGNFGDTKSVGEGLHELRIDWGPACPDFLWGLAKSLNFMRLSLEKAAHAAIFGATYRKSGVTECITA
jgi:putative addiction module killer protein